MKFGFVHLSVAGSQSLQLYVLDGEGLVCEQRLPVVGFEKR